MKAYLCRKLHYCELLKDSAKSKNLKEIDPVQSVKLDKHGVKWYFEITDYLESKTIRKQTTVT